MQGTLILPEICYTYIPLAFDQIQRAFEKQTTVTGRVENILSQGQVVFVRLGNGLIATMSFSEASIYPCTPTNLLWLCGKNIRVKIKHICEHYISVSRRANMVEALDILKQRNYVSFHVTHTKRSVAFGDIGAGLKASISLKNVSKTHVRNINEYITTGDIVNVALIGIDDKLHFMASYKNAFMPYVPEDYSIGSKVTGVIADWFKNDFSSAPVVSITPQVFGILTNSDNLPHLKHGTAVECIVTKATPKRLQLELVQIL